MCGISGVVAFKTVGREYFARLTISLDTLNKRGPDSGNDFIHENVALGHTRLAIIDLTEAASQSFTDYTNRFVIIYNGEIFNFKELRETLINRGIQLKSLSEYLK